MTNLNDRVVVLGLDLVGTVTKVRVDDQGDPIYTVMLDSPSATPDGIFYARECEIKTKAAARDKEIRHNDEYAKQLALQQQGIPCAYCSSAWGHKVFCCLLNGGVERGY